MIRMLILTDEQFHAVWEAVTQYVDNYDPEVIDDYGPNPARYVVAEEVRDAMDRMMEAR